MALWYLGFIGVFLSERLNAFMNGLQLSFTGISKAHLPLVTNVNILDKNNTLRNGYQPVK